MRTVHLAATIALLLATGGAVTCAQAQDPSSSSPTLIGQPCPHLRIEDTMVQGEHLTAADFPGHVVWLLLFACGDPVSERVALPATQAVWQEFQDHPDTLVLAIHTVFDSIDARTPEDPALARRYLRQPGWTFPVARDVERRTHRRLHALHSASTPAAHYAPLGLVLAPDGTVLAHERLADSAAVLRMRAMFERARAALRPVLPAALPPEFAEVERLLQSGRDPEARRRAEALGMTAPEAAAGVVAAIDEAATRRLRAIYDLFLTDPEVAVAALAHYLTRYRGMVQTAPLEAEINQWRHSGELARAHEWTARLILIEDEMQMPSHPFTEADPAGWRAELGGIAAQARGTLVATRAAALLARLEAALLGPGDLGVDFTWDAWAPCLTVANAWPGASAATAGVRAGDTLRGLDDAALHTPTDLVTRLRTTRPGTVISLRFERAGTARVGSATLGIRID